MRDGDREMVRFLSVNAISIYGNTLQMGKMLKSYKNITHISFILLLFDLIERSANATQKESDKFSYTSLLCVFSF